MKESYIYINQKKLRCGYTTGTCAAAAAKAATQMLLGRKQVTHVIIQMPKGEQLELQVQDAPTQVNPWVGTPHTLQSAKWKEAMSCGVEKDGGDDVDATNGMMIYATVYMLEIDEKQHIPYPAGKVVIDGGIGIGRVTKVGLDQPVGNAAINSVPRKMIEGEVQKVMEQYGYEGSLQVLIWAPEGEAIARKTFNERLGIQGGISILGTSGIVEPMSEKALVDTIRTEMQQKAAQGQKDLLVVPGNYGETFLKESLQIDVEKAIKCSNFIGDTIDMAYEYQVSSMLLVGHIGKLIKLGAGIMNTHSRVADGRMEVLASCAILADARMDIVKSILHCTTTDEAITILLKEQVLEPTMEILMKKIAFYLNNRAYEGMMVGAITFSKQYGLLGKTENADQLLKKNYGIRHGNVSI